MKKQINKPILQTPTQRMCSPVPIGTALFCLCLSAGKARWRVTLRCLGPISDPQYLPPPLHMFARG